MMKKNQRLFNRFTKWVKPLILFVLCILGCTSNGVFAQNWDEFIKKVASDRGASDYFGYSVAISGDYAVVSAFAEDHDTSGGAYLYAAGSAYIFKNIEGTWSQVQKIVASDRADSSGFGGAVAISGDYAIICARGEDNDPTGGAYLDGAGAAYIFKNIDETWTEVQKIVASDRALYDGFGNAVAISGDYAVVGAYAEDHDTTGGAYFLTAGAAYIFKNNEGTWSEVQKIVASDRGTIDKFGFSVAISGDYTLVGAIGEDHDTSGGTYLNAAGAAYIFKNNEGTWSEVLKIVASDRGVEDEFGHSVAISGDYAIIGALKEDHDTVGGTYHDDAGSAYIFKHNDGIWQEAQKVVASDRWSGDEFGQAVSISGDYAIVGAMREDHDTTGGDGINSAGSAYIFKNNDGTWSEVNKVVASDRGYEDFFGRSVGISGVHAIIGAPEDDHNEIGTGYLNNTGSAFIFRENCSTRSTDVQIACDSFTWIDGNTYIASNNTATYILTNIAGCDSIITLDLTINSDHTTDVQNVCNDYFTWIDGITYDISNHTATHTLTNMEGCDSVVTLDLTLNWFWDLTITKIGVNLTANNTDATYQWLDCNNSYLEIPGETNQHYYPSEDGSYAVKLTEDGCLDTSACVIISTVGINASTKSKLFTVYPNPTSGQLTIEFENEFSNVQLTVRNVIGQAVYTKNYTTGNQINFELEGAAGIYFIEVVDQDNLTQLKVIKE